MESKVCTKCGKSKSLSSFYKSNTRKIGYKPRCIECTKDITPEQRNKINLLTRQRYEKNKESESLRKKEYRKLNKDILLTREKENRKNKPKKPLSAERKENVKKYLQLNKEERNKKRREYTKKRKIEDPLFKLRISTGKIISKSLKLNGYSKNTKTNKILGCSFEEFKLHLESKFESWMNWNNRGLYNGELKYGWDIDHIIPLATAKTEDEIIKLNHHTNLQPLCSKINRDIKRGNNN